ncbi:NFX1-type zinc finger-containing protein 1-like protein, partial [Dinothrombium tinctorium]
NGLPYFQLKLQHRMRPCISDLLVPLFYKELKDHPSVLKYKEVKGVAKSLYFIDHNQWEKMVSDSKSRSNLHECEFVVRLSLYLVMQGYKQSQITILAMYSGQLFAIKNAMKRYSELAGVRATVVDNFQGEENDIIILSFVRSNVEGDIGFLKVGNRINVSLSRAKMGLYAIGNFTKMAEVDDSMWRPLIDDLKKTNSIGHSLELYCQNHEDNKNSVSKASDFDKVPEGGCLLPCAVKMKCGHMCRKSCHIYDKEHEIIKCSEKCGEKVCQLGHRCIRPCHYPVKCGPCMVKVDKLRTSCGHTINVECFEDPDNVDCIIKCGKLLSC